ncbi:MAG: VWA domain-containing protein [Candidatus Cloacimonetes bacterium]|nr:VWA domain-containing protein [Candidatus Cloacimonadota bacterium]
MKAGRIFGLLMIILAGLLMISCSSSDENDLEFYLYGEYTNTTGTNPDFTLSPEQTDSEVNFDGQPEYLVNVPDITITMNNLSLYEGNDNYYIDNIEVEEKIGEEWVWDPEFEVEFGNLTQLGVVLVLDVSNSLGADFEDVLAYAVEFVEVVVENAPQAQIGVVSFSNEIQFIAPGTDITAIEYFISNQEMGNYTLMYDAMALGIQMLTELNVDGRALVTFTDGSDNFSTSQPADLIDDLNTLGIRSYTMGLEGEGGVNEQVLEQLAVNGQYRLTSSKSDLRKIFQFFAESVSNVYQISYKRSNQIITTPREIRFKFIDEQ